MNQEPPGALYGPSEALYCPPTTQSQSLDEGGVTNPFYPTPKTLKTPKSPPEHLVLGVLMVGRY